MELSLQVQPNSICSEQYGDFELLRWHKMERRGLSDEERSFYMSFVVIDPLRVRWEAEERAEWARCVQLKIKASQHDIPQIGPSA